MQRLQLSIYSLKQVIVIGLFTFLLLLTSNIILNAQFVQQGGKLLGTGAVGAAAQGFSVDISADGNTAIVGGLSDGNFSKGAAWLFTRFAGSWTQQGNKLVGTGDSDFQWQGYSVSISADGNTAIVGGPSDEDSKGAAWIFTRSDGVWTQQGDKLVGTGALGEVQQGHSVSISADGNTAIVGGPYDDFDQGAAWLFIRTDGSWTQQGEKLVGTGAIVTGSVIQGYSVSISADGNTAIVGGPYDDEFKGAVWVFTRSDTSWTQQGNKIVPGGPSSLNSYFGSSVSLSADGNTAIVGGPGSVSDDGRAWLYSRSDGTWTFQDILSGDSQSYFGSSVSLSLDGNIAFIGGSTDNGGQGAAWVFTKSGGTWIQDGNKLIGNGYIGSPKQGTSVSISGDGHTAIIGGPFNNLNNEGGAWVFVNTHHYASLKVFLEGPFNTTDMNSNLDLSGQLTQPYTSIYAGTESVAAGFFSTHTDIVDWVLVELRTGTDASSKAATRACFLKSDGTIVDLDGTSDVDFIGLDPAITEYYVVVHHRNHLPVLSSAPVQLN